MNVTIQEAYDEACRQLGDAQIQLAMLARQVEQLAAENGEAGQRIVELQQRIVELSTEPGMEPQEEEGHDC